MASQKCVSAFGFRSNSFRKTTNQTTDLNKQTKPKYEPKLGPNAAATEPNRGGVDQGAERILA